MKKLLQLFILLFIASASGQGLSFNWAKKVNSKPSGQGNAITTDASGNVFSAGTFGATADFDPGTGVSNLTCINLVNYSANLYLQKLDANGNFIWARNIASGGSFQEVRDIVVDAAGNTYVVGKFMGTTDFDPSTSTYNLTAAGSYSDSGDSVDIFILKIDALGNFVWAKRIGQQYKDDAFSIALDANNNVYVTGQFGQTVDFNPGAGVFSMTAVGTGGTQDAFILKLDTNGIFVWAKKVGGQYPDSGNAIEIDSSGNIYVVGYLLNGGDFDPGTGVFNLSGGNERTFILKLDNTGGFLWAKQTGGEGVVMNIDNSGNVYLTGSYTTVNQDFDPGTPLVNLTPFTEGNQDLFIQKFDSSGNFVWLKSMIGQGQDKANSIDIDSFGNIYTTGTFSWTIDFDPGIGVSNLSAGGYDIYISKLNTSGDFIWAGNIGADGSLGNPDDGSQDKFGALTIDSSDNLFLTNMVSLFADLDPNSTIFYTSASERFGAFVLKLSQSNLSLNQFEKKNLSLYPNPTSSQINLSLENNLERALIKIISTQGQIVLESKNILGTNFSFDVSNLTNGMYVVEVNTGELKFSSKFVKQ
jgi:Secretion system C-terminal sorting domain/Beta-propeller repeat